MRHSTEYPSSARHLRMIPKSLPRCLTGDLTRRSTFSSRMYLGRLAWTMSFMFHHRTPFFPSMPWAFVDATE